MVQALFHFSYLTFWSYREKYGTVNQVFGLLVRKTNIYGINKSSRETGIDRRLINRWLKKEDSIKNTRNQQSRLCANTGQEKSFSSSMENALYDWICEKRLSGSCLSTTSIKTKAMEIFKNFYRNIHEETIVSRLLMIGS
ncbi:unnamed protein product [Brachionus calyciflorus]|uniref:HTH CENPB-type domain-containing protein n=1 Tax=Brachionus calyciflorus TaxID=104777 RepID=A0A814IMR2_9BILA|nr:unnamed protein product [Brachionus calyciflorus]